MPARRAARLLAALLALGVGCRRSPSGRSEASAAPATTAPTVSLEPAGAATDGPAPVVRFAWSAPCRVPVRQTASKNGTDAVITYDVVVEARGAEQAVRVERVAFVSVNGKDATAPAIAARLEPMRAVLAAVPLVIVSPAGEYLRVEGVDEVIDALVQLQPAGPARDRIAALMKAPAQRELIQRNAGESWNTWVGLGSTGTCAPGSPTATSIARW